MQLKRGTKLGRYEILSEVGAGGMGVVYKAKDTTLGRSVAIKVLKPELVSNTQGFERFRREAKAIAALSHSNIISLFDFGVEEDTHFTVMEFADGQSLDTCIDKIPRADVSALARSIANGLRSAHDGGIIHRDIKPSNIILTLNGEPKILDFGLAYVNSRPFNDETISLSDLRTQEGTIMGTVGYMSPEQVRGKRADERSDIFSFGVVLYELLKQKRAFRRGSAIETMSAILTEPLPDIGELDATADPLLKVAARCLEKEASARFQSMAEVVDALNETNEVTPSTPSATKRPMILAIGLAMLIVASTFLFLLINKNKQWRGSAGQTNERNATIANEINSDTAVNQLLPELLDRIETGDIQGGFEIANKIAPFLKGSKLFERANERVSMMYNIDSIPEGANVLIGEFGVDPSTFESAGKTPITNLRLSRDPKVIILEKDGYHREIMTAEHTFFTTSFNKSVALIKDADIPTGMVRVFKDFALPLEGMRFDRDLDKGMGLEVDEFYMDRNELTNREFKRFVDDDGYNNPDYWTDLITVNGKQLSFEESRELFVDATGRPGPSLWRVGQPVAGKEDFPVQGVSWYEARAYAKWAGKDLPTLYHFSSAAALGFSAEGVMQLVRNSNVNSGSYHEVGSNFGISHNGANDLCGNVSEWTLNHCGDLRLSSGGSAEDPPYFFGLANPIDPLDRSERRGFRCVKYLSPVTKEQSLEVELAVRDYTDATPVSAEVFDVYRNQFNYDDIPLNPTLIETDLDSSLHYIKEIWEIDAVYGDERIIIYVHLPKNTQPPFQSVVYFHHAGSIQSIPIADSELGADRNAFVTQSGRAFVQPVLKGMYERRSGLKTWSANDSQEYSEFVQMWVKDYRRTLDYLLSRNDFSKDKICYFGDSWGSFNWLIIGAVEPRIAASISVVGGLSMTPTRPEVVQINYVTRVTQPTLYLAGAYDPIFPLSRSVQPAFNLLGTPDDEKTLIIYEVGHMVPENNFIKEALNFLDGQFGTP